MRNLFKVLALCPILLSACGADTHNDAEVTIPDTAAVPGKSFSVELSSENPVSIDSSEYVMYPLANERKDGDGGSFNSDRSQTYWNIIFYNTATRKAHLLNDKGKMTIISYIQESSGDSSYGYGSDSRYETIGVTQAKGCILYSIISADFNKDGKLNHHDPEYLFMSDKKGNNLKQISPDGKSVTSWHIIEKSGTVLIQTVADKNHDMLFDGEDDTTPYIYDLKTGKPAEPVFNPDFKQIVNQLHKKQWPKDK